MQIYFTEINIKFLKNVFKNYEYNFSHSKLNKLMIFSLQAKRDNSSFLETF